VKSLGTPWWREDSVLGKGKRKAGLRRKGEGATAECEIGSGPETTVRELCAVLSTVRIEWDANACGESENEN
jgi:hypothetical protein